MRSIDTTLIARLQAESIRPFLLIDMEIGGVNYRMTDADVPISNRGAVSGTEGDIGFADGDVAWVSGDVGMGRARPVIWGAETEIYLPRNIAMQPVQYSSGTFVDSATVTIDNRDDYFTAVFVGGVPRGSDVVIRNCILGDDYIALGAVAWFTGTIDEWDIADGELSVTAASIFKQWNRRTTALHPSGCRWKVFRGTECTYAGSGNWCDRAYARCAAVANTANFGGFRFLPSIVDKEIWWGRERNVAGKK